MRNSEYRTSFGKLNQKQWCNSYLDNLIYRRSRRNYESNHDHLVFCWDDQDYNWTESESTTGSCDGNDSASTCSRRQVVTVKDKMAIKDKNKIHHNEPSKLIKYQEIKNDAGSTKKRHHRISNRSNHPDTNKSQSSSPKEPKTKNVAIQTVNASMNNCIQKSKSRKKTTKNTNSKEKKSQAITEVADKQFLQNRPLVVYGLGWKDNLCGPRRTFNILADNGVYKSARDAQERRAFSRQKAIQISSNQEENKANEDKDLNLWDTSRWKSEYQRCFSR